MSKINEPLKAWFKVWYVGNGGLHGGDRYVELFDYKNDEEMGHQVDQYFGALPSSVRTVNWQKVKTLPDEFIDIEIKYQKHIIRNAAKGARQKIKELEAMRRKSKR